MSKRTKAVKTNTLGIETVKKQRYIGSEEFIRASTGEVIPMQLVESEDRDFNFHKVWLRNLIISLEGITNQKLKLAFWILDNLNSENQLIMTQRAIAEKSGMSLNTVTRTMRALQDGKPAFLQKINSGAYRVNPEVVWKGSYGRRMGICFEYRNTAAEIEATQEAVKAAQKPVEAPEAAEDTQEPLPGQMALEGVTEAVEAIREAVSA